MKFLGRAPVRISLCNGGDTDYYIKEMKWGNIINTTLATHDYTCIVEPKNQNLINYTYTNLFSNTKSRHIIENIEDNKDNNLRLVTTTLKTINPDFKGDINIITNVPEKSGLGGSSSLIVAMIKSLLKSKSEKKSPEDVAKLAYKIERIILGIKGGYQDQWAAAFGGGVNYLEFRKNNVFIEPLWLHENLMRKLENTMFLFYLEPRKGNSDETHQQLEKNFKKNKKESLQIMIQRRDNVLKTREALLKEDFKKFTELLNQEQKQKEILNPKTTTQISSVIYEEALNNGAIAGKISGAGQGGCALFICEKPHQKKLIKRLSSVGAIYIPMKLERLNNMGVT